ncbi:TerC family protein [Kurthia sibirica]|uniref:TerC family protein n=1 Tax=Kurthia sibirica TaxID=202750 RepID=A0A2U3AQB6_9BACL|nr:TerC family protein [Kurthia sibirica]PWI26732.1 hypothetical protein DEX24_00070 [Kurthia sibirica]GEK32738.1 membrane protein [Kurthia sibirica]
MDILLQYGWVLLVLIALEGLLAADNAVVMAVMVKHLPHAQRKKALFYGLLGAFVLRFAALFMITLIVDWWFVQAIGAAYLLFICFKHLYDSRKKAADDDEMKEPKKKSGFWMTVVKVEAADLAFAIDSMLAAVALAVTLPHVGDMTIGGINGGQFAVMFAGGVIGLVIMRFAAQWFVKVLERLPQLETAAFLIVGWVGVKLAVMTLAHPKVHILSENFPHSTPWTIVFWTVLIGIAVIGYFTAIRVEKKAQ